MLAIKLIAGALIGTALKIACDFIEQRLLLRRNITYSQSRNERIILHIIMALVGAIIMWKRNSLYTIIYRFILLMICEVIAVTDLHHRIIPNDLILALKNGDILKISIKALDLIYDITMEKTSEIRKSYHKEKNSEKIILIEEFIKENLDKNINLDMLSKKFEISKSNLNNKFIRKFQYTPIKYLNNLRMMRAEEILMTTNKNITEISMELGLNNPSNFTRSFKNFTGLSPSEYRKKRHL